MRPRPPANLVKILQVLDEHGPVTGAELAALLLARGMPLREEMIRRLPERFPDHVILTDDGRIGAASRHAAGTATIPPASSFGRRPLKAGPAEPVAMKQIMAFHVDDGDSLAVSWAPLDNSDSLRRGVVAGEVDVVTRALAEQLKAADVAAVITLSDPESLRKLVTSDADHDVGRGVEVIDLLPLVVLAMPDLEDHSLVGLVAALDLESAPADAGTEIAPADLVAHIVKALLRRIDPDDPTWQLVTHLLRGAASPLGLVLPHLPRPTIGAAMRPRPDPLIAPAAKAAGQADLGLLATLLLGLAGSVIGGVVANLLGTGSIFELNMFGFVVAVIASVLLVGVAESLSGSRSRPVRRVGLSPIPGGQAGLLIVTAAWPRCPDDRVYGRLREAAGHASRATPGAPERDPRVDCSPERLECGALSVRRLPSTMLEMRGRREPAL